MKAQTFENNANKVIDHCWETMFNKAKEYASDEDRLANFKQPASLLEMNPAEVGICYGMKHMASIVKMAKDLDKGIYPTEEYRLEKIGDMINYLLLIDSAIQEVCEKQDLTD